MSAERRITLERAIVLAGDLATERAAYDAYATWLVEQGDPVGRYLDARLAVASAGSDPKRFLELKRERAADLAIDDAVSWGPVLPLRKDVETTLGGFGLARAAKIRGAPRGMPPKRALVVGLPRLAEAPLLRVVDDAQFWRIPNTAALWKAMAERGGWHSVRTLGIHDVESTDLTWLHSAFPFLEDLLIDSASTRWGKADGLRSLRTLACSSSDVLDLVDLFDERWELRSFSIGGGPLFALLDAVFRSRLPRLEKLSLSVGPFELALERLARSALLPKLRWVSLSGSWESLAAVEAQLEPFRHLERLHLQHAVSIPLREARPVLERWPFLRLAAFKRDGEFWFDPRDHKNGDSWNDG